MEKNHARVKQT